MTGKVLLPLSALLLFTFSSDISCSAQTAKPLSPELVQHLDQDKFTEIHAIKDIPESVKADYLKKTGAGEISKVFANPGENYQAGCNRKPGGPPFRQFILGATSSALCLIYYETGGFALVDSIDVYKLKDKEAERVWSSSLFPSHPKNLQELIKAIKNKSKV